MSKISSRIFVAVVCVLIAGSGLAQSATESDEFTLYPGSELSDHERNKAVAVASVLAHLDNRPMETWKSIQPFGFCLISQPRGEESRIELEIESLVAEDGPADFVCSWWVNYITAYELYECSNGMAFISRSGFGVSVGGDEEQHGSFYEWDEGNPCDWLGGGIEESEALNPNRRLDLGLFRHR